MKKKLVAILFAATLTLTLGSTAAFAAGRGSCVNYVDANQDNICDYCDRDRLCADENNDGICDYHSSERICQAASNSGYYCNGTRQHGNCHQGNYQNYRNHAGHHAGHHR